MKNQKSEFRPWTTGILIDVYERTVQEISYPETLASYYELIRCDLITTAPYPYDDNHDIVLDDESLLKNERKFFAFPDVDVFYCGNGVIVSFDNEGNWISHTLNVEQVRKKIFFFELA